MYLIFIILHIINKLLFIVCNYVHLIYAKKGKHWTTVTSLNSASKNERTLITHLSLFTGMPLHGDKQLFF
jgi:hypothetical protein